MLLWLLLQGLLEQAIIIPDPEAAQQQCHDQTKKSNDGGLSEVSSIDWKYDIDI